MGFGKYSDLTYVQVYRNYPSYLKWAMATEREQGGLSGGLEDYVEWAKQWRRFAHHDDDDDLFSDAEEEEEDDDDDSGQDSYQDSEEEDSDSDASDTDGFALCKRCVRPHFGCSCVRCSGCSMRLNILEYDGEWDDDNERCADCMITCAQCSEPVASEDDLDDSGWCQTCARTCASPPSEDEAAGSEGSRTCEEKDEDLRGHAVDVEVVHHAGGSSGASPHTRPSKRHRALADHVRTAATSSSSNVTPKRAKTQDVKLE